jgi:hypothetical protein
MSIADSSVKGNSGLIAAHNLAAMGVPIFRCRLDSEGNPEGRLAHGWQKTEAGEASHRAIDLWEPGMGLCAVTGPVFDVVDVDPRNGGAESWPLLLARLAEDPPLIFGMAATPSRGAHFWIASQNVAKTKLMKGIDLQARGGFVFIAPTMRPSKAEGDSGSLRPYQWVSPVSVQATPWVHAPSLAMIALINDGNRNKYTTNGSAPRWKGRRSPEELMSDALAAEAGEQHYALLALVEEYQKRGWPPEAIRDTMRNFLPRMPVFEPEWPWITASDPDKEINGLMNEYRDGCYWRDGKRIVPDATDDETDGLNDVIPNIVVEEDPEETAFWESRPVLKHIRDWARARRACPWAVFGEAMSEAICHTPPTFQLPPMIGGEGTLNMLIALVGRPGAGKGAAARVARAAFKWEGVLGIIDDDVERRPVGTGEGLVKTFGFNRKDKDTGQTELFRTNMSAIVTIAEIDTFEAIKGRGGSTISPELRKVYSGEMIGFGYADAMKATIIPEHEYRCCVIAGVQPGRAEVILNDDAGGLAQRWLWLPAEDKSMPQERSKAPKVFEWEPPGLIGSLAYSDGPHIAKVCDQAWRAVDQAIVESHHGQGDDMDAHAAYTQLKVAMGLALLDGSDEVRDSDWDLAGFVMRISGRTLGEIRSYLAREAHKKNIATAKAEGLRQQIREETADIQFNTSIAKRIMSILQDGEWISYNALSKKLYQKHREALRDVLNSLIELGKVESQEITYQGRKGKQFRRVESDG